MYHKTDFFLRKLKINFCTIPSSYYGKVKNYVRIICIQQQTVTYIFSSSMLWYEKKQNTIDKNTKDNLTEEM